MNYFLPLLKAIKVNLQIVTLLCQVFFVSRDLTINFRPWKQQGVGTGRGKKRKTTTAELLYSVGTNYTKHQRTRTYFIFRKTLCSLFIAFSKHVMQFVFLGFTSTYIMQIEYLYYCEKTILSQIHNFEKLAQKSRPLNHEEIRSPCIDASTKDLGCVSSRAPSSLFVIILVRLRMRTYIFPNLTFKQNVWPFQMW